ncbi:MAG: DUF6485 family protein [Clostridia bacterium]|nr:DUF6485 family protein [Clostridia bacterium]
MDCVLEKNKAKCACTDLTCSRRGACCACVEHHRSNGELPGCFFTPEAEKTYDRSIANFIKTVRNNG